MAVRIKIVRVGVAAMGPGDKKRMRTGKYLTDLRLNARNQTSFYEFI